MSNAALIIESYGCRAGLGLFVTVCVRSTGMMLSRGATACKHLR